MKTLKDKLKYRVTGAIERGEAVAIEAVVDLRPYHWHINNTQCHTWFERDRANVRLEDLRGNEIMCLWDSEVEEFIENGFKRDRQSWHSALSEYATERKLKVSYK